MTDNYVQAPYLIPGTNLFTQRLVWLNRQLADNNRANTTHEQREAFRKEKQELIGRLGQYMTTRERHKRRKHEEAYTREKPVYPVVKIPRPNSSWSWGASDDYVTSFRVPKLSDWKTNFASMLSDDLVKEIAMKHNIQFGDIQYRMLKDLENVYTSTAPLERKRQELQKILQVRYEDATYPQEISPDPMNPERVRAQNLQNAEVELLQGLLARVQGIPNNNNLIQDID